MNFKTQLNVKTSSTTYLNSAIVVSGETMPSDELIDTIADEMKEYSPENDKVEEEEDDVEDDMNEPSDEFVVEVADATDINVKTEETLAAVVVASEEDGSATDMAQIENVTLIQDDGDAGQEAGLAEGGGGGDGDIVIQIMTPDGQIVTTTTKQSELMQTLQLEGGVEGAGEQTFVLQAGDETVQQFQVILHRLKQPVLFFLPAPASTSFILY